MSQKQLPVNLQNQEIRRGLHYLLIQMLLIGPFFATAVPQLFPNLNINTDLAYYLVNFTAVMILFRRFLWQSLKYSFSHLGKLLLVTGIGLLVYFLIMPRMDDLVYWLNPKHENYNDTSVIQSLENQFWSTFFGIVILIPLTEEILYRGLIFGGLYQKSHILAYTVSVCSFGLIHVLGYVAEQSIFESMLSLLQYIPAGLILAWTYEYSGSILAPTLIHTAVNAFVVIKEMT